VSVARRIGRLSKRELLIIQARKMKLKFKLSISEDELVNLINRQPITEAQREYVNKILERLPGKPKCPERMTYGQFRQVRTIATENDNEYAIEKLNLEEGNVFEKDGEYFHIKDILGDLDMYKMWVQKVNLHRGDGEEDKVIITPISDRLEKFDPLDLLSLEEV